MPIGFKGLIRPTSFVITEDSMEVSVNNTVQIPYTLLPSTLVNKDIRWTSSDETIAIVNSSGIVTGVSPGDCVITGRLRSDGTEATIDITTVPVPVTGVTLNYSSYSLYPNKTLQLTATVAPSDASNKNVTWTSSDTSVATVNSTGLVTWIGGGNTIITVTTEDGGYTATCAIESLTIDTCFSYTGNQQSITLPAGKYCMETWGAGGGGSYYCSTGGKGAYAAGTLTLTTSSTFYIYVGGCGPRSTSVGCHALSGGYNGGGTGGGNYSGCSGSWSIRTSNGAGGGGTDIKYNGTSLYNRFIVAGGGSGSGSVCNFNSGSYSCGSHGGFGGGGVCGCGCYPGTQTEAGCNGDFGQGANTICNGSSWWYVTPGGGGGWYGGGGCLCSGQYGTAYYCMGSGGSSYTYTSSTCGNHPCKECLGSLPLMTNAVCCGSGSSFPTATGGTETGHTGHGCVRIRGWVS